MPSATLPFSLSLSHPHTLFRTLTLALPLRLAVSTTHLPCLSSLLTVLLLPCLSPPFQSCLFPALIDPGAHEPLSSITPASSLPCLPRPGQPPDRLPVPAHCPAACLPPVNPSPTALSDSQPSLLSALLSLVLPSFQFPVTLFPSPCLSCPHSSPPCFTVQACASAIPGSCSGQPRGFPPASTLLIAACMTLASPVLSSRQPKSPDSPDPPFT